MADELKWILGIVAVIALLMIFTGHLDLDINLQSVLTTGQVSFRTDVVTGGTGSQYNAAGKYIAVDYNNDGALECFVYSSYFSTWTQGTSVAIAATPEGFGVFKYGTSILVNRVTNPIYIPTTSCGISLATSPTPPYKDSNQEVCVGGACPTACIPDCTGRCGGVSDGCGGSCTAVCTGTQFVCDSNSDGSIDRTELGNVISKWAGG